MFAVTKVHSQCGFSIVHKRLWPTRLSHSGFERQISIQPNPPIPPKNLASYSGRPEYDHVKALSQHLKSVNVSRTPITVILYIPLSQVCNAFRAQVWASKPREANLRLVQISASRFFAGSFFIIRDIWIATWHNALAILGLWSRPSSNVCTSVWFNIIKRGYCLVVGVETYVVTDLFLNSVFKCFRNIKVVINMTVINTV